MKKHVALLIPTPFLLMYFSWTTPAVRRMSETFNLIHISTWEQDKFTLTQEKNKQTNTMPPFKGQKFCQTRGQFFHTKGC
jgi:hypothetical protein